MSRASVAVMAAFAPKPEAGDTSKVGQPERVEDSASDGGGSDDGLGLSAEEQAQFDAMASGKAPAAESDIDPAGTVVADDTIGDVDGDGDGEADSDGESGAADGAAADGISADAAAAQRPPKTISYGKYQRELKKIQDKLDGAVAETAKEREQRLRLDERTTMLLQAIQTKPAVPAVDQAKAAAEADPEPDKEADPIGHLEWRNRKLEKTVSDLSAGRQQEQQLTAAQQEEADLYRVYEADILREAQADPTFQDAFAHLRETRYRELGFIYADIDITDPAQCALLSTQDQVRLSQSIQQSFHNEQMLVAREAIRTGKSPAKKVASLAKARGWEPKAAAAAPAAGAPPAKPANGAAPPARQVAPAAPGSVKDQLEAIRDGQEASRSLSDAGGSPGGAVTPERIANMTDEEFLEFYENMPKGQFDRQVLGKPAPN
jgi:hypothetical protein